MRLGCIAALGALYLLWSGGQGLVTALSNRQPARVDCGSYAESAAGREWLELTDCSLNLLEASYTEQGGRIVELFIPARGRDAAEGSTIHVLVATRDDELISIANDLMEVESDLEMIELASKHSDKLFRTQTVSGLVRYGVDLDESERADLKALDADLAESFVILDEGAEPGFARALASVGGGAVLLLLVGGLAAGNRSGG